MLSSDHNPQILKTMKTTLYLTGILALLVIAASCEKKERTTVVSGTVINAFSNQPIDSVKVSLLDGVSTAGEIIPGNTSSGLSNVAYTNKEGKFKVQITGEYEPFLAFSKQDYKAPNGGLIQNVDWGSNTNDYVCKMIAKAWFNPVLAPKESFLSGSICPAKIPDIYCFDLPHSPSQAPERFEWDGHYGWGANGDTYRWYILKFNRNGDYIEVIDSVYIKSLETYTDTIYF